MTVMNNKILELLKRPYALLVWALICGAAYYVIIGRFVFAYTNTQAGGSLLMWLFLPAVICGAALILVKVVKQAREKENDRGILILFYTHLLIIAMGIVFLAASFI